MNPAGDACLWHKYTRGPQTRTQLLDPGALVAHTCKPSVWKPRPAWDLEALSQKIPKLGGNSVGRVLSAQTGGPEFGGLQNPCESKVQRRICNPSPRVISLGTVWR